MVQLINTKSYDILAHLDLPKKYGYRYSDDAKYYKMIDNLLDAVKLQGLALECSTAGLRKYIGEIYPDKKILKIAIDKDIPILVNSDAHKPSEVGYKFKKTLQMLRNLGLTKLCKFSNRKIEFVEI